MGRPARVLVADDNTDVQAALRLLLKLGGLEGRFASTPAEAIELLGTDIDALLMDMNYARDTTSGGEGVRLLEVVRARQPDLPVVVMTAWGSVEGAVACLRLGALDYVQKPWDNDRLLLTLRNAAELGRTRRTSATLAAENDRLGGAQLVAEAPSMRPIAALLERVAPSDASVLVMGEHGTGKEVVARFLHTRSLRARGPFVPVHTGSVADGVFESEMFGHTKGAFTDARAERRGAFSQADGGTLFLDEIGTMPLGQQAKLLRALETGEISPVGSSRSARVDIRLVTATNADLDREAREGRFRPDLLYRINTVIVRLPPLRERREDIPALAAQALDRWSRRRGRPYRLSPPATAALLTHPFPGNVRELEHAIERAVLLSAGDTIGPDDLGLGAGSSAAPRPAAAPAAFPFDDVTLEEAERILIERALARASGNVSEAAARLGLSRSALYRRLARFGLGGEGPEGSA
jgi:DNA-binding NtrC family response regulator